MSSTPIIAKVDRIERHSNGVIHHFEPVTINQDESILITVDTNYAFIEWPMHLVPADSFTYLDYYALPETKIETHQWQKVGF